ncbi:MAG: cytochrome c oxidase assembly protein [Anaerolinea sp.]|nr:cytochrome c oxidase assembly protein [Anaerolinea sp.]
MTRALLLSWDLRPEVIFVLGLAALIYLRGWLRLRALPMPASQPSPAERRPLAAGWRLAAYWAGLASIAVALMSPVDVLSSQLFFMHMSQHLLLTMVAVPLLLIGNPFPVLMWGLPRPARRPVSAVLSGQSVWRRVLVKLTSPGIVWLLYVICLIIWHDPLLYNLVLRNQFVHDLQHLSFFITTMLLWWHILGVAPRLHRTMSAAQRIIYTISVVPVNVIIGVVIAFSPSPIYEHYVNVPRLMGLSVMADQMIAGILMWIPGSEMFFWAALIVLTQIVSAEAKKPVHTHAPWLVEEHAAGAR